MIVISLAAITSYILPLGLTVAQNGVGPPGNDRYAQLTQGPPPSPSSNLDVVTASSVRPSLDDAQVCDSKDIAIGQAGSSSNCGQGSAGITEDTESAATLASPATLSSPILNTHYWEFLPPLLSSNGEWHQLELDLDAGYVL